MSEIGIIRQYLVSLGFSTDSSSFSKAQDSLNQIAKSVTSFTSSLQGIAAAAGVTATVAAIATSFEQLTLGVADATIKNQEFARQMWMGFDQAVAFKSSLDALGVSIQDLYLSPTLMNAFIQFRQLAQQMKTPADFQSTMDSLAQVTFQFDEFKLEASYAIQWVGYALAKDLAGPFGNFQDGLKKLNTWIITTMPSWTKKIADFIVEIITVFKGIYDAGKNFVGWWDNLGTKWQHVIEISTGLIIGIMAIGKAITIVMGIAAGLADANLPLLAISAAILAIILLAQDYYTHEHGGKSALGDLWADIDKFKGPELDKLKQSFSGLGTALLDLLNNIGALAKAVLSLFGANSSQSWANGLKDAIDIVSGAVKTLTGLIETALGIWNADPKQIEKGVSDTVGGTGGNLRPTDDQIKNIKQGYVNNTPQFMLNIENWLRDQLGMPHITKKASGGSASGPTLVGEKGPEILNLPGGSQIFSNSVLTNMLNAFKNLGAPRASNKTSTITLSPVYYISGAGSPQQTADAIQGNNLSLIMRVQQGIMG